MDLTLFFRVIWRYRILVMTGLLVAVLAAFLAMVRITPGGSPALSLRGEKSYASYTTLFVTQTGFPWGRLDAGSDTSVESSVAWRVSPRCTPSSPTAIRSTT